MHFPWLWTRQQDQVQTLGPQAQRYHRSSDVVFNESAMHKTTERPIEVLRAIFAKCKPFMTTQPITRGRLQGLLNPQSPTGLRPIQHSRMIRLWTVVCMGTIVSTHSRCVIICCLYSPMFNVSICRIFQFECMWNHIHVSAYVEVYNNVRGLCMFRLTNACVQCTLLCVCTCTCI